MNKVFDRLFSTSAAGLYMILFAIAIGVATFIENDFGTSAAQKVIFRAKWFEFLLLLFAVSLIVNILRYRMIQQKKWTILAFHASIIVILIGAAVTRYFSYEGMMHIREGESSNTFVSAETYLQFQAQKDEETYAVEEPVLFASLGNNHFNQSYQLGDDLVELEVNEFIPNPSKELTPTVDGPPIIKVVMGGTSGREEYYLKAGDRFNIQGLLFSFNAEENPAAINIRYEKDSLLLKSPLDMPVMTMATQQMDTMRGGQFNMLKMRSLYTFANKNFVIADFLPSGKVEVRSADPKMKSESVGAVDLTVRTAEGEESVLLFGQKGVQGRPEQIQFGNLKMTLAYGSRQIILPFSIHLHDFQMERYPGTNSASSYASEVTLIDPQENVEIDYRIFMNNILNYGGYRFFQSSFDQDELGTYLSVNHDFWGTWISYLGYALLTIGMILTLFSKKSRFTALSRKLSDMRKRTASKAALGLMLLAPFMVQASMYVPKTPIIDEQHAEQFGHLVVQDHRGRLKPMSTMASEVLRKLARKNSIYDQTAEQVFLGMMIYPDQWSTVPVIKLGHHEKIRQLLGAEGPLVAYTDFFDEKGQYKLRDEVRRAHGAKPIDRGTLEKELIKADERLNIMNMVLSRRMMRIYPIAGDPNNRWLAPGEISHQHEKTHVPEFQEKFFPAYAMMVRESEQQGDWRLTGNLIEELDNYQRDKGTDVIPSQRKIDLEILLNELQVFSRLGKIYGLLGLAMLVMFFMTVFKPVWDLKWPIRIGFYLLSAAFTFHVVGLGLRWYVSGHAPWSNGYESMIYIAFTTVLAGLIFARKSAGGLAATALLSSIILMVAGLSWMDPEITPLVPVLKSYWLTIHVSLEAGSYGFLMLGAIIGLVNLILLILQTESNQKRVRGFVKELTYVSEMTLIGGLFMISIGTYLGGVWANESWGRYWGWDAKETWALVTILVYAFILHMRFIPGFRGLYAFNVASLFGFASVMMTYFGVNYYLSGLHSYAAGDPMPLPPSVYYTAATFFVIGLAAFIRDRMVQKKNKTAA